MEQFNRALATSFRILSKKAYSRHEIEQKLIKFEYDEDVVQNVLIKLDEMKLIDDEDYAELLIEGYARRGYGRLRIKEELYKRGVPSDILKEKMLEYEVDFDIIIKYFERKLANRDLEYKEIEKAKAYVYRKGFTFDEVNSGYRFYKEMLEDG
ncbi:MAG: regulatory protein RecX [Clostridia bacterium]